MLCETIESCIYAIEFKRTSEVRRKQENDYQAYLQKLLTACKNLSSSLTVAAAIINSGALNLNPIPDTICDQIKESIDLCGIAIKNRDLSADTVKLFENVVKNVNIQMSDEWKKGAYQYSKNTVAYLSLISDLTDSPMEIRNMIDKIKKIVENNPTSKAVSEFVYFMDLATKKMELLQIDDYVKRFLQKVQNREATMLDLTPEVMDWFYRNHMAEKLRITF